MAALGRALVTGGTGVLGKAVYETLTGRGFETHVTASSPRSAAAFVKDTGAESALVHVADLTSDEDAKRLFREVDAPLHALVTTIGGFTAGPLADVSSTDIDGMTNLNLKPTILALRHAYPYLKAGDQGAGVVMVGARSGVTGGAGVALYSATKAAVVNLALSLAQEWQTDDINVNAVLPSIFDTPANRAAMPDADFSQWAKPSEIAEVAAFLVSAQGRIVSGGAIPVYGKS